MSVGIVGGSVVVGSVVDVDVGVGVLVSGLEVGRQGGSTGGGSVTAVVAVEGGGVDVEVLVGAAVGVTVTVTVLMHPTSKQEYPGMQHPPPGFSGQLVCPSGQEPNPPSQASLSPGQHPTSPRPVSSMIWHTDPFQQQLLERSMDVHGLDPTGHSKLRLASEDWRPLGSQRGRLCGGSCPCRAYGA